jgi:hypothetical protein
MTSVDMNALAESFSFTQSSLQDYLDCPRRFQEATEVAPQGLLAGPLRACVDAVPRRRRPTASRRLIRCGFNRRHL